MDCFTMCMDRTSWKHGSKNVNYLVVSIAGKEPQFPLFGSVLTKKE
ncbi:MAG: hypothetical protein QS721_06880 [Candidatus Endonucleobacter sp. (ex Gigantidas childressi)]|nr:hypothetical protein [Candidatus Endonucleobacter sp. (ex Gigantidas childressi)]